MKRNLTYGTFDLIHYGHINLLKRAKEQGDYLIVALSTDEFNWNEKQKKCYFTYEQRKALVELRSASPVDFTYHLQRAKRSDLQRSDLQRSDLQRSDLQRSDLQRSDLQRV